MKRIILFYFIIQACLHSQTTSLDSLKNELTALKKVISDLSEASTKVVELNARITDLEMELKQTKKTAISGFIDFEFTDFASEHSSLASLNKGQNTFSNSHLNFYLNSEVSKDLRVFSEIRFLYKPNLDFTEENLYDRHGGSINIERAWIEYIKSDAMKFKFGKYLIPYGIWNVDHGSPILISTRTPIINRRQLFPESVVGIQLYGAKYFGNNEFNYFLWVGNNKGETQFEHDDFSTKAFGGRLQYSYDIFDKMSIGFSFYRGQVKDPQFHITDELTYKIQSIYLLEKGLEYSNESDPTILKSIMIDRLNKTHLPEIISKGYNPRGEPMTGYKELAFGVDINFELDGFHVQAEYIANKVTALNRTIPKISLYNVSETKDNHSHTHDGELEGAVTEVTSVQLTEVIPKTFMESGGYIQLNYTTYLSEYSFTPFFRYGFSDPNDLFKNEMSELFIYTNGINLKPIENWVFKLEYHIHTFHEEKRNFNMFTVSSSVAF